METKDRRNGPRPVPSKAPRKKGTSRKERKLRDSDVVYTPPKPFKRGRFVLHLATVVAVVLAVVLGMSIFFKVETVKVSGCKTYTEWEIAEASGIETGSNLLTVSRAQVSGNIISRLPYVDSVRVGIFLPDTVNIEIKELDIVYAIEDAQGNWWLMNDEGKIVEQINTVASKEYTRILGVRLEGAEVGKVAVAEEPVLATIPVAGSDPDNDETSEPTETTAEPEATIRVGVTGAERLSTALAVIQQLSSNSISGQVDSVDVSNLTDIELWYDERFQINLGNTGQLEYKVSALKATINRMESYESGYLDLTFTSWQDKVGYTPFT